MSRSISIFRSMYQSTIRGTSLRPRAPPNAVSRPSGDQLKGAGGNFLPRSGDAGDHAHPRAAVATLQPLAHQLHVAHALEAVVRPPAGQLDKVGHQIALNAGRVAKSVSPKALPSTSRARFNLHHVEPDSPSPNTTTRAPRSTLAVKMTAPSPVVTRSRRSRSCRRERRCVPWLPLFPEAHVVGEGGAAHVVKQRLALEREAARPVGHQALALGGADGGAEGGLPVEAGGTPPAFWGVERDDAVALLYRGHARAHLADDARPFVLEDDR